jgi:hypothetical protein
MKKEFEEFQGVSRSSRSSRRLLTSESSNHGYLTFSNDRWKLEQLLVLLELLQLLELLELLKK